MLRSDSPFKNHFLKRNCSNKSQFFQIASPASASLHVMLASSLLICKRASSRPRGRNYATTSQRRVVGLGKVTPRRNVPSHIQKPPYVVNPNTPYGDMPVIPLLTKESEIKMRVACQLARKVLNLAGSLIRPGITTEEIDEAVHEMIIANGAYPSPLEYHAFPKSCCTSVNNVLCHGIPCDQKLFDGDIINVDITVYIGGYHGDCSETFMVGEGHSEEVKKLVKVAKQSRDEAIAICGPGVPLSEIGKTIHNIISRNGYTSPENLVGHGIGPVFHAQPSIFHCLNNEPGVMKPGMTFTIEPLICQGNDTFYTAPDNWTLFSNDNRWSAQFEHTILITPNGHDILTL